MTPTTLAEVLAQRRAMLADMKHAPSNPTKMVVRRVDHGNAVAYFHGKTYLLSDSTGSLDYADLNRPSVRVTEIVVAAHVRSGKPVRRYRRPHARMKKTQTDWVIGRS